MTDVAELLDGDPAAMVEAKLHYTKFPDPDTFAELVHRHGLEYAGIDRDGFPGTPFLWGKNPGTDEQVILATACHPITTERFGLPRTKNEGEIICREQDEEGYASYLYLAGPAYAAEPLYQDVHETAELIKGEFQPLGPVDHDEADGDGGGASE